MLCPSGVAISGQSEPRGAEDENEVLTKTKLVQIGILDAINSRFCQFHSADWDAKSKTIVLETNNPKHLLTTR
jgi:hypothetical protein